VTKTPKVLVVVPLRLASVRVPQKILQPIHKTPLAVRTVGRVLQAFENNTEVAVLAAVDSPLTKEVLQKNFPTLEVMLTDAELPSGTDRVFAASSLFLKKHPEVKNQLKGIINVQGDMPFVGTEGLKSIVNYYLDSSDAQLKAVPMATLAESWPFEGENALDYESPSAVKVLSDHNEIAIYFSRHPIPCADLHIGVYGYTFSTLNEICGSAPVPLELEERLEQLRELWLGIKIRVLPTTCESHDSNRGMDTPEDMQWAERFANKHKDSL